MGGCSMNCFNGRDQPAQDETVSKVGVAMEPQEEIAAPAEVVLVQEGDPILPKQTSSVDAQSVEDVEGLLNIILLLSALCLSFSLPMLTANDIDANLAIDTYFCKLHPEGCGKDRLGSAESGDAAVWGNSEKHLGIVSYAILDSSMMSSTFFLLSLVFGTGAYISLAYAGLKDRPKVFHRWFRVFKWVILCSFGCFVVGIIYFFFCLEYVAYSKFPLYNLDMPFNKTSNEMNTNFICNGFDKASGGMPKCAPFYYFLKNIKRSTLILAILVPLFSLFYGIYASYGTINVFSADTVECPLEDTSDAAPDASSEEDGSRSASSSGHGSGIGRGRLQLGVTNGIVSQLKELAELKEKGMLTEQEFSTSKKQALMSFA